MLTGTTPKIQNRKWGPKSSLKLEKNIMDYYLPLQMNTVFPHIVAAATILFWKLECGNYSREETIQRRKLLFYYFFISW